MLNKNEFETLAQVSCKKGLSHADTFLLIAVRKVIDGPEGMEFQILAQKMQGVKAQAEAEADRIKQERLNYIGYVKEYEGRDNPLSFVEYYTDKWCIGKAGEVEFWMNQIEERMGKNEKDRITSLKSSGFGRKDGT